MTKQVRGTKSPIRKSGGLQHVMLVLVVLLVASTMLVGVASAADTVTLKLEDGSVIITETGYAQGDVVEEISYTGPYTITQTYSATVTANTITLGGTQQITLDGINIDAIPAKAAVIIITGTATVTLVGENFVTSAENFAGVQVDTGTELIISADSTGSLIAKGGRLGVSIGGGFYGASGNTKRWNSANHHPNHSASKEYGLLPACRYGRTWSFCGIEKRVSRTKRDEVFSSHSYS